MDGHNGLAAFFKRDCIKGVYLFKPRAHIPIANLLLL